MDEIQEAYLVWGARVRLIAPRRCNRACSSMALETAVIATGSAFLASLIVRSGGHDGLSQAPEVMMDLQTMWSTFAGQRGLLQRGLAADDDRCHRYEPRLKRMSGGQLGTQQGASCES